MEQQSQEKINLRQEVLEIQDFLIEVRRHIHQYPETCYEEVETAKYIVKNLEEKTKNLKIIQNVGKTGVVAILEGKQQKTPVILLRGDIDALNLTEKSGEEFSSKIPGKHHACGHDGHAAMLLGAAIIADKWADKIKGTIKFCFQPAEEGGAGADAMIKDKIYPVLQNPEVEKCYAIHLNNSRYYPAVLTNEGPMTANSDRVTIKIVGKGGHAMCPDQTVDAMMIGCNLVQNLYTIGARNIDPMHPHTISFGKIVSGTSPNIISQNCEIEGSVRTFYEEDRQIIIQRFKNIVEGFEKAYDCKIDLDYKINYNSVINHQECVEDIKKYASKIYPVTYQGPSMAGEDFSFFSAQKKSCMYTLGSAPVGSIQNDGKTILKGHHSPFFTFDERAIALGSSIWIQMIEDMLINEI